MSAIVHSAQQQRCGDDWGRTSAHLVERSIRLEGIVLVCCHRRPFRDLPDYLFLPKRRAPITPAIPVPTRASQPRWVSTHSCQLLPCARSSKAPCAP